MTDDTAKFEAFAPKAIRWMPKWVRENASPKAVWSVLVATFTAGVWVAHESGQRMALEHANAELEKSQVAQVQATKELTTAVNEINNKVTDVKARLEGIGKQVDAQQAKWDRVESAADIRIPKQRKVR